MQDRYGLPLTTSSTLAAERFIEGIDLLREQNFGLCRKFCSGGHEGTVVLVYMGIRRPGNRIVQPQ
jgi:hypothetical protein